MRHKTCSMIVRHCISVRCRVVLTLAILLPATIAGAAAPQEKTIYSFQGGNDGSFPSANLVADSEGNLYGMTEAGGGSPNCGQNGSENQGCGTIFKLTPPAKTGGAWAESILYSFQGSGDGSQPSGGLTIDAAGNLYGVAGGGSSSCGCGVIFELSPSSSGVWAQSVLYTFTDGPGGGYPIGSLALDSAGRLYGITSARDNCGDVFEATPPSQGGTIWTEAVIYQFQGGKSDGCAPAGTLVFDKAGNLYGTAQSGGQKDVGIAYRLKPPTAPGAPWALSILHSFTGGTDGAQPVGGLIFHGADLFGTTYGGGNNGDGVVFQLSPPAKGKTTWVETPILTFNSRSSGQGPLTAVVFDKAGNLYGTTRFCVGGVGGEVFELSPPAQTGNPWTESTLYSFTCGSDGCNIGGLAFDKGSALYGLSGSGGTAGDGVAFAVIP
jgi:uncharacterized repeat protein (TIGR03803 family)